MPRQRTCDCGVCQKCLKREQMRRWYHRKTPEERRAWVARRDPENVRARDRARSKTAKRIAHNVANTKRWRRAHPGRSAAHSKVARAVRAGKLSKEPCAVCGTVNVHAHHEDYDKPLDVIWLCPLCHAQFR